jgi:hypothetical protein
MLLAKSCAIQIVLEFCRNKGYKNIVCESHCLEVVELFNAGWDNTLHVYASDIFYVIDVPHETDSTSLIHIFRKQNICADFGKW